MEDPWYAAAISQILITHRDDTGPRYGGFFVLWCCVAAASTTYSCAWVGLIYILFPLSAILMYPRTLSWTGPS
jgi:hypothetical protein